MSRIYVGTSSWSDHANFYPPGLPSNQQITFYAQHFPIVEINSTFYRMMPARNFQLWAERTPPGFIFDVKPYRQLTWHDRENPPTDETFAAFRESLQPLRDAGKLGAITFQFPPRYAYSEENLDYIRHCRDAVPDDRLSIEFRNRSWFEPDRLPRVLDAFKAMDLALTVVDEPQVGTGSVPIVAEVSTPDLSVVRFHGRNVGTWYKQVERTASRFDYLYSEDELREWVPRVARLAGAAREVHVFFNNNKADYAVTNARQLTLLLRESLAEHEVIQPAGLL